MKDGAVVTTGDPMLVKATDVAIAGDTPAEVTPAITAVGTAAATLIVVGIRTAAEAASMPEAALDSTGAAGSTEVADAGKQQRT